MIGGVLALGATAYALAAPGLVHLARTDRVAWRFALTAAGVSLIPWAVAGWQAVTS